MQQLLDWNGFDVFAVARFSRGRPLQTVTWALLQHFGLVDSLSLPAAELCSFLKVGCLDSRRLRRSETVECSVRGGRRAN